MRPTFDISVQYFGIDWPHISRVARNLVQLTESVVDMVRRGGEDGDGEGDVDLVLTR